MRAVLIVLLAWIASSGVAKEPSVYLHETFEEHTVGETPVSPVLRRAEQVTVHQVGDSKVAHYNDSSASGGALEYNVGMSGLSSLHVSFDLLNNNPQDETPKSSIIFSVGP